MRIKLKACTSQSFIMCLISKGFSYSKLLLTGYSLLFGINSFAVSQRLIAPPAAVRQTHKTASLLQICRIRQLSVGQLFFKE